MNYIQVEPMVTFVTFLFKGVKYAVRFLIFHEDCDSTLESRAYLNEHIFKLRGAQHDAVSLRGKNRNV